MPWPQSTGTLSQQAMEPEHRLYPPNLALPARAQPVQVHEARCVRRRLVDPLCLPLWTSLC